MVPSFDIQLHVYLHSLALFHRVISQRFYFIFIHQVCISCSDSISYLLRSLYNRTLVFHFGVLCYGVHSMDCFFFYLIPFSIYCFCSLVSRCLFSVVLLFKSLLLLLLLLPLLWQFLMLFFHHCFFPLFEVAYSAHSHFGPALRCQSKFNFVYSICTYRSFLINPLKCMHISIILNNTNVLTTNLFRSGRMEMS